MQHRTRLLATAGTALTLGSLALVGCTALAAAPQPPAAPPAPAASNPSGGGATTPARTTTPATANTPVASGTVTVTGGFATDRRDGGRPVVLIAAALGVPTDVFRTAFSAVSPAAGGTEPSGEQVQANKAALLRVLAPYGVTNDRLDEVSNHYRYFGGNGESWRHVNATATATIVDGKVRSIKLTRAGAGYSSTPTFRIAGYPKVRITAKVAYGTNLATNGRIASLRLG